MIKTHEGVNYGMRYYECERFFVVIERGKKFGEVKDVVEALISKFWCYR